MTARAGLATYVQEIRADGAPDVVVCYGTRNKGVVEAHLQSRD
jgi:hypothetical protein